MDAEEIKDAMENRRSVYPDQLKMGFMEDLQKCGVQSAAGEAMSSRR